MTFTQKVQKVVTSIPQGETLSYQEVARLAGSPNAHRAVATIMRKNYDHQIPCHRVICSDGSLGGYNRGGGNAKLNILRSEGWESLANNS